MATSSRSLNQARIDWLRARVANAPTRAALPRWPPSQEVSIALGESRVAEALHLPDKCDARYLVHGQLRPDASHLWAAVDEDLGREVVLKLGREDLPEPELVLAWEGTVTAQLRHPNIITIYEAEVDRGYLVFERLDGDLGDQVRLGHLDGALVLDALCQAGRGLAVAHTHGLCHGDLKPENILVQLERGARGEVTRAWGKLADFGSARFPQSQEFQTGQWAGCHLEDQRCFAATVWECLTASRRPPDSGQLLPKWLHAVLSKAQMHEPSQRWADMTALVDAIERGRETTAAPKRPLSPASSPPSYLLDRAIASAADGQFATAAQRWREHLSELAPREGLGREGFSLGAALFNAARRATGATKQLGYARTVEVLQDAARLFELADELDAADEVRAVTADACLEWMQTYPPSSTEHHQLIALERELRSSQPTNE